MPIQFSSGEFVTWNSPETGVPLVGKILNMQGLSSVTKGAALGESGIFARVRVIADNELTPQTLTLPIEHLQRTVTPDLTVTKSITPDNVDTHLSTYSEEERRALAVALFAQQVRPLPSRIVGEEGQRVPLQGITGATGNVA